MTERKQDCGACNLCCKLLAVPDIQKPARMLCWWTGVHGGCERHAEKATAPELKACHQFRCLWLASQDQPGQEMPRGMRPDISHVVMGPQDPKDETLLYVQVDPDYPKAWLDPTVHGYLQGILSRGGKVEVILDNARWPLDGGIVA